MGMRLPPDLETKLLSLPLAQPTRTTRLPTPTQPTSTNPDPATSEATRMARVCLVVTVPGLRVKSEMNGDREHWAVKGRRTKSQKVDTLVALNAAGLSVRDHLRGCKSLRVRFTRIGGRQMDTDNLVTAFKYVRDAVSQWLDKDDGPGSGIEWVLPPGQEPGAYAVRIEIEEVG